ncbi:hypothetical protein G6F70_003680 [Rhizopus microsporus]|uniref:Nucleolar protein 12 n=2 Tax=Rhizopus TaxID=4842 RepID=A0A367KDL6_RHIAZ|nr:hypothetical protein G6F71_003673 [Rhizopus microsporus]RCI00288.1 Nucleolar protein 12 [Rhizopus azygosporus]KAG1200867.1 hypothetical protein G6F70_003680 [Rhizopus microsporus]KAG1212708.1 hypothetical protein G6F69_003477 [Rhizopus microsporus]KAG1234772.1 hypothetical protein G6F67_003280 [Rhizopus microsporus]
MSGLVAATNIDNHLDDLFKHSAGKSEIAVKPILPQDLLAKAEKKRKNQEKKEGNRAFIGFQKAKELLAQKRKAEQAATEEEEGPEKKKKKVLTEEEKLEKEERTVFIGNLSVACIEKEGYRQLKSKFKEFGKIESIRFRSIAFSQPMNRKAAFLARKLHSDRDVLNAYIVYEKKESVDKALELNGTIFMEKHLRVDAATKSRQHDRKRSVFLGGLPFDIEEEELWEFFKECGDIEFVRTIRDPKTNVGKGFGYVQFKDRDSVEAALNLEKKIRDKVKIRIQRCKVSVSEGGTPEKKPKKKGKKPVKTSGKAGKPLPNPKRHEGTRATKDSGNKFKLIKTSKKRQGKKK